MGKNDRRNKHGRKNWNNQASNQQEHSKFTRTHSKYTAENIQDIKAREAAIQEFKSRTVVCSKCGKQIADMTNAISDADGNAMHFDCVVEMLKEKETMTDGQQMTYIGNGRFAVVSFENPRDLRKFKIEKIIEYEDKSKTVSWRDEMAGLYSQIK